MPGPGPHYPEGDPRNEMCEAEAIAYSESHPRTATPCPQTLTDLLARTEKQVPSTENPVVAALRAREAAHLSELADYGRTVTVLRARVEELEAAIHGAATSLGNAEAEIARLRNVSQNRAEECETCNGSGTAALVVGSGPCGEEILSTEQCPECGGTGRGNMAALLKAAHDERDVATRRAEQAEADRDRLAAVVERVRGLPDRWRSAARLNMHELRVAMDAMGLLKEADDGR